VDSRIVPGRGRELARPDLRGGEHDERESAPLVVSAPAEHIGAPGRPRRGSREVAPAAARVGESHQRPADADLVAGLLEERDRLLQCGERLVGATGGVGDRGAEAQRAPEITGRQRRGGRRVEGEVAELQRALGVAVRYVNMDRPLWTWKRSHGSVIGPAACARSKRRNASSTSSSSVQ
jgi:hypothetical protein